MNGVTRDLRLAWRQLRRRPGFAAAAILTLALGAGATTTIFSIANAALLQPLPFPEPDRLVRIWETSPNSGPFSAAEANYLDFRARSRTLAEMAAFSEVRTSVTLTGRGAPERLDSAAVTSTFFRVLGTEALSGRTFLPEEDRPGGRHVVVVSHDFWVRRLAAAEDAVGRTVTLDGEAHEIVGVMPPRFGAPEVDVWVPLRPDPRRARNDKELAMIGRLKPGVTLEEASAELDFVARQLGTEHPDSNRGWGVRVASFSEWVVGPRFRQSIGVLCAAVSLLLLMACANVANLLLARATTRRAEFALRAALGAGHGRIVRQLLIESALIGVLAAVLGLALAVWALAVLAHFDPGLPRLAEARVDTRVLAFALGVGLVTSLLFGLAPAGQLWREELHQALRLASRGSAGHSRLREALTVCQVSLALVLLIGAGLLLGSFLRLRSADLGFDTEHVLAVPLELHQGAQQETKRSVRLQEVLRRLERLPGVLGAGATTTNPLRQGGFSNDVTPEERAAAVPPSGYMQAGWRSVTPGLFDAMGIPLRRGRVFTPDEGEGGLPVAVISETLARRLWPGEDPIGKRLFWGGVSGTPRLVVGVVGDIKDVALDAAPPPVMFVPYEQVPVPGMTVVIRTPHTAAGLATSIRQAIWEVDRTLPVPDVQSISQSHTTALAGPRFNTLLLGLFAVVALALAVVGIYAIMAFTVARRTREIGIRIALGARPQDVRHLILRRGAVLTASGVALGLAGAWSVTRFLGSVLYETAPTDAAAFAGASLVLAIAAMAASYIPARRALHVDPVVAVRDE